MNLLPEALENYIEKHTSPETEALQKLNRDTYAHVMMPNMLSGQVQGRFLKMLVTMIQPKTVLEIGTFTGYSGICIAEGMNEGTTLHSIDINEELRGMVEKYVKESGQEKKIKLYTGNALDIIPTINSTFDMVFIDADKKNYSNYYDIVFDKVRKGGYIIADNVLWSGKVVGPKFDKDTQSIVDYNNKVMTDPRVENVLVPMRDGLMIARKLV